MTCQTEVSQKVMPLTYTTLPRPRRVRPKTGQASTVKFPFPPGEGRGRGGGGVSLTLVTSHGRNLVIESAHGPALWCNPSACDSSPLTFLKNV